MYLTFWTMLALLSVPALLFWLAFALWKPQPITEYIYDDETGDLVPYQKEG